MARPEGFEPPTAWFVARYSNPTELRARIYRNRQGIIPEPLTKVNQIYIKSPLPQGEEVLFESS